MSIRFLLSLVPALALAACSTLQSAADAAAGRAASNVVDSAMSGSSSSGAPAGERSVGRASNPDEDDHHLIPSDWFVTEEPYKAGWIYVHLAQQMTAPSEKSKAEGEYMLIDGRKLWTKYQYRTRPASRDELKLGMVVIVPDHSQDGVYVSPDDRDEARQIAWFMATITDLSDLFKNEVAVGTYKARPEALRVIVAGE